MGKKKNVDLSMTENTVKVVKAVEPTDAEQVENADVAETTSAATSNSETADQTADRADSAEKAEKQAAKSKKSSRSGRSHKYQAVRAQVDKTKLYDVATAIELVKKLSYTKFAGTIEAHVQTKKDAVSITMTFPHSTGKSIRVAIVSPEVLEKIENNQIDFDILLATPADMSKITKFARILGPKGMMPNPKTGTLIDDTAARQKELEGGQITLKTEKKAPLIHTIIGKTDMDTKALTENLQALLTTLKNDAVKVYIAASMSPSIRVKVE